MYLQVPDTPSVGTVSNGELSGKNLDTTLRTLPTHGWISKFYISIHTETSTRMILTVSQILFRLRIH
eukprot:scaffold34687_cov207-Amphora_coffeaeformis.AAC.2